MEQTGTTHLIAGSGGLRWRRNPLMLLLLYTASFLLRCYNLRNGEGCMTYINDVNRMMYSSTTVWCNLGMVGVACMPNGNGALAKVSWSAWTVMAPLHIKLIQLPNGKINVYISICSQNRKIPVASSQTTRHRNIIDQNIVRQTRLTRFDHNFLYA